MSFIKEGDFVTVAGIYALVPNPNRGWWQLWRPKFVQSDGLETFKVVAVAHGKAPPAAVVPTSPSEALSHGGVR